MMEEETKMKATRKWTIKNGDIAIGTGAYFNDAYLKAITIIEKHPHDDFHIHIDDERKIIELYPA
ncbi:hypothetical protein BpsS140_00064 [Bacillus phage vB_BpsS-140]|nr:hypothetical protein BpsS140_00064 [Bacillus phage vB_BpsS-140]